MKSVSSGQSYRVLTASSSARHKPYVALLFCLLTIILASATVAFWSPTHERTDASQFENAQASPIIGSLKKAPLSHSRRTAEATPKSETPSRDDFTDDGILLETRRATFYPIASRPVPQYQSVTAPQLRAGPAVGSRAPPSFS